MNIIVKNSKIREFPCIVFQLRTKVTNTYHVRNEVWSKYVEEPKNYFLASDIQVELTKTPKELPPTESLFFGQKFSDHMFSVEWTLSDNWKTPRISPLKEINLHPGAKVLHYASSCFEGLKAFRGYDGKIRLFRPMDNMYRFLASAERAGLPSFDPDELMLSIKKLIKIDERWVPEATPKTASSLYIRPTMFATQPALGLDLSQSAMMYVLLGPSGPYYKSGAFNPISLLADSRFVRAWPGGVGCYKMACNYAPTINVMKVVKNEGCSQMLWLYGEDQELTEVGSMNLFVYLINEDGEKELITAPLHKGLILPGVTRQSVLDLTRQWNEFKVSEKILTMSDLTKAFKEKRILEIFGSGTAVVVVPVGSIKYEGKFYEVESEFPLAHRLYHDLLDIQYGVTPNKWMMDLD